jgi:hypothetical protein
MVRNWKGKSLAQPVSMLLFGSHACCCLRTFVQFLHGDISFIFKKKQDSISGDYQPIRTSLAVQAPVSVADVLAARTGKHDVRTLIQV